MSIQDKRKFYINGQWVYPLQPNDFDVLNPANEESIATISIGTVEDINLAVDAARRATRVPVGLGGSAEGVSGGVVTGNQFGRHRELL